MAEAFTVVDPVGDGVTTTFEVSYPNGLYGRKYIHVFFKPLVGGESVEQPFNWLSDGMIQVTSRAPTTEEKVEIRRIMKIGTMEVSFKDGDVLDEHNLDLALDQLLNLIQEIRDGYGLGSLRTDLDMNGNKIINVGWDPDDPNSLPSVEDLANLLEELRQAVLDAQAAAGYKLEPKTVSDLEYVLTSADEGHLIRMTNAQANTVRVPQLADIEEGSIILVRQSGDGSTTLVPDTGVQLHSSDGLTVAGEDFCLSLVYLGGNAWDVVRSVKGVDEASLQEWADGIYARMDEVEQIINELLAGMSGSVEDATALSQQNASAISDLFTAVNSLQGKVEGLPSPGVDAGLSGVAFNFAGFKVRGGRIPALNRGDRYTIQFGTQYTYPPVVLVSTNWTTDASNHQQNDWIGLVADSVSLTSAQAIGLSTTSGSTSGAPGGTYIVIGV